MVKVPLTTPENGQIYITSLTIKTRKHTISSMAEIKNINVRPTEGTRKQDQLK